MAGHSPVIREWHVSAILFRMFSDFGSETKKVRRIIQCCLATHSSEPMMASSQTVHGGRLFIVRRKHRWRTSRQDRSTYKDNTLLLRSRADGVIADGQALTAGPDFEAHFHIDKVPGGFEAAASNGVGEEGLQIEVGHRRYAGVADV